MTIQELADLLTPLVQANPQMRVVLPPCSPGEDFVNVESGQDVLAGNESAGDRAETVFVIS